uniref:Uncharacterized protein n=1 Tax=Echeneis naucrates TaxID=173247 RepID=A0A665TW23_ECHNA
MYSTKEDTLSLSPDELRRRLYQTFKNKGVLDTLKTQLRNQLIQELKHPPLTGGEPVPRPVPAKSEPLLVSVCNSMVADHLSSSGYEYTLSVFYPESGLCKEKVFTKEDFLHLLKISPQSGLYRSLVTNYMNYLLVQLIYYFIYIHMFAVQIYNDFFLPSITVEKMKMIDKEYENLNCSEDKWFPLQSKLAAYRKEIEAQMQAEMNTKMQHFKDVEIAKVRLEEKSKFHKEFDKLKQDLEKTYEMKKMSLMDREKNAIERLQKQQEIEEKNVYMQRQSLLKEIETLRNREHELRMRTEAFEESRTSHKEKVKTTEELLRRRELAVKTMEDTHDQRLQNELYRYFKDEHRTHLTSPYLFKEYSQRWSEIVTSIKILNSFLKQFLEFWSTSQQQVSLLTQQKDLLGERLETMSDYPSLKREKAELQGQLRLLKKQLDEAQEENRLLHADLGKPSKEQLALQMELRRLQSARRVDEEEFDNQRQVLQAQLQSEMERCAQLKVQLTECEEKLQWMTNHVEDIKMQLRQTQQAGGPLREHKSPLRSSQDSDMELVITAKARIQELTKEAETLEEAYRNYQQRAVRSTISHMLPPRPLSPQQPHPSNRPTSPLRKHTSHHSHTHSPYKPKDLHRPLSSQITQPPPLISYDPRNIFAPAQPRVTFSEAHKQPESTVFPEHSLAQSLFQRDKPHEDDSSSLSRRLSSTRHSSSRKKLQTETAEGTFKKCFIL